MKNVLVIGGSGFLGSHVSDQLSNSGYNVIIYDHVKSKYLRQDQKMIVGDITDLKLLDKSIKNMQYVYHFAGIADIHESTIDPSSSL